MTEENNSGRESGIVSDAAGARGVGVEHRRDRISKMEELYRKLEPELRRTKPNPEAIAAALEAAQRLATESDAELASDAVAQDLADDPNTEACPACGYQNRARNKFCGMCGMATASAREMNAERFAVPEREPADEFRLSGNRMMEPHSVAPPTVPLRSGALETHHYHHHYHHHYFPAGYEPGGSRPADAGRSDAPREEKFRANPALRGDMSRAEAGVRRVTQEWMLACNTKHLDDLLELYASDAMVLRSNHPPVRGAAAVREFFFAALDAGLGEVELEPLRVEIMGDLAYEAGKCKALVPSATGKRREERGKYLWVCARQSNGEWKLTADCWSSDLSLGVLESDVPAGSGVKTSHPKKG